MPIDFHGLINVFPSMSDVDKDNSGPDGNDAVEESQARPKPVRKQSTAIKKGEQRVNPVTSLKLVSDTVHTSYPPANRMSRVPGAARASRVHGAAGRVSRASNATDGGFAKSRLRNGSMAGVANQV